MQSTDYQKGYQAGRRKTEADIAIINSLETRNERVYLACLKMALEHCNGWAFGDEKINNAEGYCKLAAIFAKHSISKIKD